MKLTDFLNTSYTAYHTTANLCEILLKSGFTELTLGDRWKLAENGKYFVTRNGSSIVAFRVGANKVFNLCQSHTDSPSLKVKGNKFISCEGVNRINVEKYGGGITYTFFDRPLKIAGRILLETPYGTEQRLVVSDYNVVIPSLAIHHNPTVDDGFAVKVQCDALPVMGQSADEVYKTLTDGKVLDADLYAVPATEAFYAGANNELLCSPRLDNLTSAYTSVKALCNCNPQNIAIAACLDNEEVGSGTRQGSPRFVSQVIEALSSALKMDDVQIRYAYENGMSLSIDNGHAVHPAHPEKSDPVMKVHMNDGVVVKHHPNYATDGLTSAIFKKLCDSVGVKYQDYYNNSSVRCGSTLGLATSAIMGIKTCDIGLAQLAMHSACETCGASDIEAMEKCLTAFLSAKISGAHGKIDIK